VSDQIPNEIKLALAEILNLASAVAELQTDDKSHEAIYGLLDSVAEYFEIDHQRPEEGQVETGFVDASDQAASDDISIFIRGTDDETPKPDRDFGANE